MSGRTMRLLLGAVALLLAAGGGAATNVGAATEFAAPVFGFQWESVEANRPNFLGPLANASPGIQEPYVEAAGSKRLVQYFDKARMELAGPNTVTNGLLTVELKTGKMQVGNNAFEQRLPAVIGIAGDPGQAGPTYADLAKLPERAPQAFTALTTTWTGGDFIQSNVIPTDPNLTLVQYLTDPGGRYGQFVPKAFWDYMNGLPLPWQAVLGYPISPAFGAQLVVGGAQRPVFIQAFERRVLTYTPGNPAAFAVEFGNIGQHYSQWRYGGAPAPPPQPPPAPPPRSGGLPSVDPAFATAAAALAAKNSPTLPLGDPAGAAYDAAVSFEKFENGSMFYLASTRTIYVLTNTGVQLSAYQNTWTEGDPNGDLTSGPRPGTYLPRRGFGKVWRENAVVQLALGYATADERGYTARTQFFTRGLLLDDPADGLVWSLNLGANVWDAVPR